jgi:putative heme iron utilization protein
MRNRQHATGSGNQGQRQELLYDADVPTPTHAERARTLVEQPGVATTGTLSTQSIEPAGYPYGSFVTFALDEGRPVFLISALAEHTKNLQSEPRCSLLVTEQQAGSPGDPLAYGRVTLVGTAARLSRDDDASAREAFLERHPNAAYYADFDDFGFWRMSVEAIRYIGGYGRMSWVEPEGWADAQADPLAPAAARIVEHMNEDHAETMALYCRTFSKAADTTAARMTGVDRYGFEMSATTGAGPRPIRLAFSEPVETADEARAQLVSLAKKARSS